MKRYRRYPGSRYYNDNGGAGLRPNRSRHRHQRESNISIGEGLGHVAVTGGIMAVKAGIKTERIVRKVAGLGYRTARGIYRTFRG